jgi:hypothetical protein
MTKRQFFEKALLASLPLAVKEFEEVGEPEGECREQNIALYARDLAIALTVEFESQMERLDEVDVEHQDDPEWVQSTRDLSYGPPPENGNN